MREGYRGRQQVRRGFVGAAPQNAHWRSGRRIALLSMETTAPVIAPAAAVANRSATPAARLPWQFFAGLLLCVATLVALDTGFLSLSRSQIAARDRLERTVAASRALDHLQALMVDAETAARGYALVGREVMLEPYRIAQAEYGDALDEIGRLTAGDALQEQNLDVLRARVRAKWVINAMTLEAVRRNGPGTVPTESAPNEPSKVVMDSIRSQVALMKTRQSEIHDALAADFHRAVLTTRGVVLSASVLAVLASLSLYGVMRRFFYLRLRFEAELLESEQRYRILTEVAPQIVWMADLRGEMTFCSRQWIEYSGLTLAQSMAAGAASVVHPDDRHAVVLAWRNAIEKRVQFEAELRLRRADGAYRWHLARARPLFAAAGGIVSWFGAATDIEDRKQVEIALDRFNTALAVQVAERTATLEERSVQLRALNQNLTRVSENERSRLARELHDELGAQLSVAMMDLTMISRRLAEVSLPDLSALASRLGETLNATTQISRRILSDLRPVMIGELGLAGALDAYCAQFETNTGIRCERLFPDRPPQIADEAGIALFRIVQESLSNVVKYAAASEVRLTLSVKDRFIELLIEDDGVGMTEAARTRPGSHGLIGIRERARAFGGDLYLTAGLHGRGAGVRVTLAMANAAINDAQSA